MMEPLSWLRGLAYGSISSPPLLSMGACAQIQNPGDEYCGTNSLTGGIPMMLKVDMSDTSAPTLLIAAGSTTTVTYATATWTPPIFMTGDVAIAEASGSLVISRVQPSKNTLV